jgi:adenylate cyclase
VAGTDRAGLGSVSLVRPELFLPALGGSAAIGLTNILPSTPSRTTLHPEVYSRNLLPAQGVAPQPSLPATLLALAGRSSRQVDRHSELHTYGPEGSLARIPAWEVLDPERWARQPLRGALPGALVLVGPTVSQGADGYPSPFGSLSGLELLATATANSLQGDGLAHWPVAPWARALLVAAPLALLIVLVLRRDGLRARLLWIALVLVLQLGLAALVLTQLQRWLPMLPPVTALVLLGVLVGGDAYVAEERERRRLRRTFERYVAPSVVAEILADPQAAQGILRGRVLEVTVLFSDLKGFTQLTRRRSAAGQSELHVRQLNRYLGAMVDVINRHGGTVDKFIGDAVMAVFGSPVGRGRQAEACAAVDCALEMARELERLNGEWQAEGLEPLASGIGLASGEVLAGQIGSPQRLDFTVIGDTVNLASRLESLTRLVPASLVVDGATAALLVDHPVVLVRSLGCHPIKGLGESEVFAVVGR